jgi:hypothetical protein
MKNTFGGVLENAFLSIFTGKQMDVPLGRIARMAKGYGRKQAAKSLLVPPGKRARTRRRRRIGGIKPPACGF